jgi:hypothetical protein
MGRRSFAVRDIVDILEHWRQGRSIRKIAVSLGVDRKTVVGNAWVTLTVMKWYSHAWM